MRYAIIITVLAAVVLNSCISFNRRYEYMLADSTSWKYDHRSALYETNYDANYFRYTFNPKAYYSFETEKFKLNIETLKQTCNIYSFGPILPIIPLFINDDEPKNKYWGIKRLICELKYRDSVRIESCYLEINNKNIYRPAFGKFGIDWIDRKSYERFDTNQVAYSKVNNLASTQFEIRFVIDQPVIESAVLHFDSVYVDGKIISLPPLSLKKEYAFYFDEQLRYLLR